MLRHLNVLFCFLIFLSCRKDPSLVKECALEISDTVITNFEMKGISYVATNSAIDSTNITPLINVNCNWISQMPFAFGQVNSTQVSYDPINQWWGETDIGIITTTQLAKTKGIKTLLKPQLWFSGTYSGAFTLSSENDWLIWENNYRNYILHFAHLADSINIEMFCVGTELKLVVQNRPSFWSNLIDSIRSFYGGKLIYAANWDDYNLVPFWNKLDYIGIDGYFPISTLTTPPVEEIIKGWTTKLSVIDQYRISQNKDVVFTEIGYKSVDACAYEPWNPVSTGLNIQAQANAVRGFLQVFANKAWFKGAFIWKWYPKHESSGGNTDKDYTPQNKSTQIILKKAYS